MMKMNNFVTFTAVEGEIVNPWFSSGGFTAGANCNGDLPKHKITTDKFSVFLVLLLKEQKMILQV
jgi:hypothetical protein